MFGKLRDFDFLRERVHTSLEGWKCKLLWRAGRMTLIKLVIRGLPMYSMPTFTYQFQSVMNWTDYCEGSGGKGIWKSNGV